MVVLSTFLKIRRESEVGGAIVLDAVTVGVRRIHNNVLHLGNVSTSRVHVWNLPNVRTPNEGARTVRSCSPTNLSGDVQLVPRAYSFGGMGNEVGY